MRNGSRDLDFTELLDELAHAVILNVVIGFAAGAEGRRRRGRAGRAGEAGKGKKAQKSTVSTASAFAGQGNGCRRCASLCVMVRKN